MATIEFTRVDLETCKAFLRIGHRGLCLFLRLFWVPPPHTSHPCLAGHHQPVNLNGGTVEPSPGQHDDGLGKLAGDPPLEGMGVAPGSP